MNSLSEFKRKYKKDYNEYINSLEWYRKRMTVIMQANHKCQQCGKREEDVGLEVHHLHYKTFRNEKPEDMMALCPDCHKIADEERKAKVKADNENKLYEAQVWGWARKVYGERACCNFLDFADVAEEFDEWLESKDEYD